MYQWIADGSHLVYQRGQRIMDILDDHVAIFIAQRLSRRDLCGNAGPKRAIAGFKQVQGAIFQPVIFLFLLVLEIIY